MVEVTIHVATCNLSQWALDYDGNLDRIKRSIVEAKTKGAKFRVGPELEISGYSCEDHFHEMDMYIHCDQSLALLLSCDVTDGILCDIGMPVLHNNVRYNCRIFVLNRKIVLIRPKMYMADDGNYRERRFFSSWKDHGELDDHLLSEELRTVTGQTTVPFGIATIATYETVVAAEICEELWTASSPHVSLALAGVEVFSNGSGSHHELRKLNSRLNLVTNAMRKCGGIYLYANLQGCDGTRLYFDGCSLACVNGDIVAQASQFSVRDVEVITAVVDLNEIRSYRGSSASFQEQSSMFKSTRKAFPQIDLRWFSLQRGGSPSSPSSSSSSSSSSSPSRAIIPHIHIPEEECALGPACWLWDYLRRSGAGGFLLPLSGGADSSSVATIVHVMCALVIAEVIAGDEQVIADVERIVGRSIVDRNSHPGTIRLTINAEEFCANVLHTVYMGTENSSMATRNRSMHLAQAIGAFHSAINIDLIVSAVLTVFTTLTTTLTSTTTNPVGPPRYESQGGTPTEDLALQNIQARLRMVMAYLCSQLLPWVRGKKGFLLVLGSANVDEALRGYMTKYDCSSADINPIGGICKVDLKRMMLWASGHYTLPILREIAEAAPSAELRPIAEGETSDYTQTDEEDMGMSYQELGVFGTLRKVHRCGPVTMFVRLWRGVWSHLAISDIAAKVKRFFYYYAVNRHKMTVLTPSYHAEAYSPDDNRFDLRPFLYNTKWPRQFATIDKMVADNV